MLLEILLVFVVTFFSDVLWTLFIRHTAKGNALVSASTGAAIYVFNGLAVIVYVGNPYMLIPAAIGGFIGSYITVIIDKNMNRKISKAARVVTYPDGFSRDVQYIKDKNGCVICTGNKAKYKRLKKEYLNFKRNKKVIKTKF